MWITYGLKVVPPPMEVVPRGLGVGYVESIYTVHYVMRYVAAVKPCIDTPHDLRLVDGTVERCEALLKKKPKYPRRTAPRPEWWNEGRASTLTPNP